MEGSSLRKRLQLSQNFIIQLSKILPKPHLRHAKALNLRKAQGERFGLLKLRFSAGKHTLSFNVGKALKRALHCPGVLSHDPFKEAFFVRFEYGGMHNTGLASSRTRSQAIRVLANPNVSQGKERVKKEVIMVDPSEAKRLAAKQMDEIKAKERFQRRRQIEAINGAWAMIGLTAGLVIEGHTGLSIPSQLASYLAAVVGIFTR